MTSSRATMATAHLFRPKRRVWVNRLGHVLSDQPSAVAPIALPAPSKEVEWDAHVVDIATQSVVDAYPRMSGLEPSAEDNEMRSNISAQYIDKCRFADKQPNLQELKDKVAAGVWEIHIELKPTP